MLRKYITITLMIISFSLSAQVKNNDIDQVISTIESYFDGYVERDRQKLTNAFDLENGTMKVPIKNKEGKEVFENKYFSEIIPKWASRDKLSITRKNNCSLEILNIDIVNGEMSTAKINMKIENTIYVDVLSLQKINQQWKITNKMYIVKSEE